MHTHEEELIFSFLKTTVELISSDGLPLIICFLIFNFLDLSVLKSHRFSQLLVSFLNV